MQTLWLSESSLAHRCGERLASRTQSWNRWPAAVSVWKAPWEEVSRQRGNGAVGLAYYLGQRHAGMTLRELGKYMGEVEYPAVSVAIARFQNRLKTERSLQRRVKQDREIVESRDLTLVLPLEVHSGHLLPFAPSPCASP